MRSQTIRRLGLGMAAWAMAVTVAHAQARAEACFFSADFEEADALTGWEIGPAVERRTPEGVGLGEFVPAWTLGNADEADAAGYFAVPDSPIGNRFAMANDAAAPCNCDLNDVALTSPLIDLSGRTGVALECRVFHDGIFGSGPAVIEYSMLDGQWLALDTIPTVDGQWQRLFIDLGAADGSPTFRLRIRWSDGGVWAGGFAIDDVCLRERRSHDLVVVRGQLGSQSASAFETGDQLLHYTDLPVTQVAPVTLAALVKNGGRSALHQVRLSATIDHNGTTYGPFTSDVIGELFPGEEREMTIPTGWQPIAPGQATLTFTGTSSEADEAPSDEVAVGHVRFTAPGWADGYAAMRCDQGVPTATVGGTEGFIVLNRMEIVHADDHAAGITVAYGHDTEVGAVVRAVLMDGSFTTVDTSMRRTLSQADIDAILNGMPLYEAFHGAPALAPGDYHVGIQHLAQEEGRAVHVQVGGEASEGRSVIMEGATFLVSELSSTPMVRLHLAEVAVAIQEAHSHGRLQLVPNPAVDHSTIRLPGTEVMKTWTLTDMAGRMVLQKSAAQNRSGTGMVIELAGLPAGTYLVRVETGAGVLTAPLVVLR